MSSSPLYLAIVVVWLIVLVPMLLRRDPAPDHDDQVEYDEPVGGEAGAQDGAEAPAEDSAPEAAHPGEDADDRAPAAEDTGAVFDTDVEAHHASGPLPEPAVGREPLPPPRARRARVIARRRRRTTVLVALLGLSGAGVAAGLGPWWVLVPPTVLLLGHLVLLREAAKADAERRAAEERRRRRLERIRRARAEAAREAEVIELMERRNQVYDQYTDAQLRAAGD
ncbi:hypothetical protein ACFPZ0_03865 [Streptomonospora nanhaiensis]|uniref:Uncharacterized protein n=1 Tax=Streptomonospora nanhaiensis TaxID=1323731 RepID=A0A853BP13_9ACTN|nr:hypothetical protein [Streptomonospora nanhaiensis]MBV2361995.1 hypothetical protein [Streptomonospora nanhaiensis]MBX9386772.1 hypothetical protein [Streptomonospora nanhaiensis]NYI96182.1 hypothetical protein [Streptomonospora nanhaiensis]